MSLINRNILIDLGAQLSKSNIVNSKRWNSKHASYFVNVLNSAVGKADPDGRGRALFKSVSDLDTRVVYGMLCHEIAPYIVHLLDGRHIALFYRIEKIAILTYSNGKYSIAPVVPQANDNLDSGRQHSKHRRGRDRGQRRHSGDRSTKARGTDSRDSSSAGLDILDINPDHIEPRRQSEPRRPKNLKVEEHKEQYYRILVNSPQPPVETITPPVVTDTSNVAIDTNGGVLAAETLPALIAKDTEWWSDV